MNDFDIIIIGAGPAGLFAALHCGLNRVLVLEKKTLPGRKLMISGSGRCNLTHEGNLSDFFDHYGTNSKFLRTALYRFSNTDLIEFFTKRGIAMEVDKNGKVFPASGRAEDILKVLLHECHSRNVNIYTGQEVNEVSRNEKFRVQCGEAVYTGKNLLIATGGMSYPATGSTGDGYRFAKDLGHSIIPPKPALSPVIVHEFAMSELAGVSVQNRMIYLYRENKKISEHRGDIGFTHKGLSGPGILDFSREMQSADVLRINFVDQRVEEFRKIFIETAEKSGRMAVLTFLKGFDLPRCLVKIILTDHGVDIEQSLATISKDSRNKIVESCCEYPFIISKVGGFNMAMVTKGGISLSEVSIKTMESKKISGLYFSGEVLDIDGDTGGYNLQAAFSTAFLAAESVKSKSEPHAGC